MTNKRYTEAYNILHFYIVSENEVRLGAMYSHRHAKMAKWIATQVSNLGHRIGFTGKFYKIYWHLIIGMPVHISYF